MPRTKLGRVQLQIMQVLWDQQEATAREITDKLNEQEQIAHSTVQTLLRGLEEKGSVAHRAEGRTFLFYPLVKEDEFKQSATRDLIDRVYNGSISSLVSHLLENEKVSGQELVELRRLIDASSKKSVTKKSRRGKSNEQD